MALDADGNALAVWARNNGTEYIVQASVRPAGSAWQPAQDLSAPGQGAVNAKVALNAGGNAVAVWQRSNGTNEIVQAAVRAAGGAWQPAQDLSAPGQDASSPRVSIDPAGNAVAVWERFNGSNFIVQASVRPAGGAWQLPAQELSAVGQSASSPQVALDPAGNAVAVWDRSNGTNRIVQAAVRPAGGSWLPPQDLSAAGANADDAHVAFDPAGNAVAVWSRFDAGIDIVQAAVRPAASGIWQAPENLSAVGQSASRPQVALDAAGNAVAVWHRSNGTNDIVQAAVRPPGGAWQPGQDLSAPGEDASQPQVALDPAGDAVAVWRRATGTNLIVQAAVRPGASGIWQGAQDLSTPAPYTSGARVALDPAGNALTVWERTSGGTGDVVQAAPYDAAGPVLRNVKVPATGFARQRLTFSVDPIDVWSALAGEPVWSFGDGKGASGRTVRHTYTRRGTFTVSLSQADALGNLSTATRQLVLRTARCFGKAATRVGTPGPDRIVGTRRADVIVALGGNDRVRGRGGNDRICGGKGRDRIAGGAGNDLLNGGPGRDICSQGGGRGRLVAC